MLRWVVYAKKPEAKLWDRLGAYPDIVRGVNDMVRAAHRLGAEKGELVIKVELEEVRA